MTDKTAIIEKGKEYATEYQYKKTSMTDKKELEKMEKVQKEVIRDKAKKAKEDIKKLSKINKKIMKKGWIFRKAIIEAVDKTVDRIINA